MGGYRRVDLFSIEGKHLRTLRSVPSWTPHLAWHKDGKLLGFGGVSWIGLIDVSADKLLWKDFDSRVNVAEVDWNPAGTELAAAWEWPRHTVAVYDKTGKQRLFQQNKSQIQCLCWSQDGRAIVTGFNGHDLKNGTSRRDVRGHLHYS